MGLFDSRAQDDKVMGSFILTELRDLRKGMEGRDGELRGEITAVRDAVATLSTSVSRSHSKSDNIQTDVDAMRGDFHQLRRDVDNIQQNTTLDKATKSAEWSGPKRLLGAIVGVGSGAAAITAIIKFWPILIAL